LTILQLYAAIHEWRSGRHHPSEFSTNAYLDVYQGHIDTFHHIQEHRSAAFHLMMSDIYAQAKCMLRSWICHHHQYYCMFSAAEETAAILIVDIDLKEMDG